MINTPTGSGRAGRRPGDPHRGGARGDPLHHDDDRRLRRSAGDRRPQGARSGGLEPSGAARAGERSRQGRDGWLRAPTDASLAPFGRRRCEVLGNREAGGYRIFSLLDADGPAPQAGQFYMLATAGGWGQGGERPFLPRAFSVAAAEPAAAGMRLDFLVEGVGPGTDRLCRLAAGEEVWVNGPLGRPFSTPEQLSPGAAGAILVGGGIGIAPLAILRRALAADGFPARVLLGFRDRSHSGGVEELFDCSEVRLASEDGHRGHRGYVTDLLGVLLEGDAAAGLGGLCLRPAGDAGGGAADVPGAGRGQRAGDGIGHGMRLRGLFRLRRARSPPAATCGSASTGRRWAESRFPRRWWRARGIDERRTSQRSCAGFRSSTR